MLSCEVTKDAFWVFRKSRLLVVTNYSLVWFDKKKHVFKFNEEEHEYKRKDLLTDIAGVTKSLYTDNYSFVLHFKKRADEELCAEQYLTLFFTL